MKPLAIMTLAFLVLQACGQRGYRDGPDEFSVLPVRPLVIPEGLTTLPPPSAAAGNRADLTPRGDAIRAVGGNVR